MAIGSRAQSARTYLEKHFKSFSELDKDALIRHALQALRGCLQGDQELTAKNASISVVGENDEFTILEGDALQPYVSNRGDTFDA